MKIPMQLERNAACLATRLDEPGRAALAAQLPAALNWSDSGFAGQSLDMAAFWQRYAALRWRAETGSQASDWCCLIDPVVLLADMRDVRLREWPLISLDAADADALADALRELLAADSDPRLRRMQLMVVDAHRWYLLADAPDALDVTAAAPALLGGQSLREHKPTGRDAGLVQRLLTEVQMLWYDHPANAARQVRGLPAVNGVWLAAAGGLPEITRVPLPPLISGERFFQGCWQHLDAPLASTSLSIRPGAVTASFDEPALAEMIVAAFQQSDLTTLWLQGPDGGAAIRRLPRWRRWLQRA